MRSEFPSYYPPTDSEIEQIWNLGDLILDTNSLLNLFRYTEKTRNEFLSALRDGQDRLWLPHQVGLEFHRNRLKVIYDQDDAFREIDAVLPDMGAEVSKVLQKYTRHPSLESTRISKVLEASINSITQEVAAARERHEAYRGIVDDVFGMVSDLYSGRLGVAYDLAQLEAFYKEADARYEKEIPPGYEDHKKSGGKEYGDFILWKQILDHGEETRRPAIFVTDDAKVDWWYRVKGKTQGARVELIDEYFARSGSRVHFYAPERFLQYAQSVGSTVSSEALDEVERVSSARAKSTKRASALLAERREQLHRDRIRYEKRLNHPNLTETAAQISRLRAMLNDVEKRIITLKNLPEAAHTSEFVDEMTQLRRQKSAILDDVHRLEYELDRGAGRAEKVYRQRLNATNFEIANISEALAEMEQDDEEESSGESFGEIWPG